jgi:Bacterial Ig domain
MKRTKLLLLAATCSLFILVGCKKDSLVTAEQQPDQAARKGGSTPTGSKPTVSFIYPLNGTTVTGTINVQIAAASTIGIRNTSLMTTVGTSNCLFGNDATAPYSYIWDTNFNCITRIAPGTQVKLRATATDAAGATSFVDVTVTKQ